VLIDGLGKWEAVRRTDGLLKLQSVLASILGAPPGPDVA